MRSIAIAKGAGYDSTDTLKHRNIDWPIVLDSRDVFGNAIHTIHASNEDQPWARVGIGPSPVALQRNATL